MRHALFLVGVLACSRPIATASPIATRAGATTVEVATVDAGGCVDPDGDGDGVVDVCDVCPAEAGERPDGCVHRIEIQTQEIRISTRLFFRANSAALLRPGLPVLDEVASVLRAHPEILQVELRGHASVGERNVAALSLRRAEAVRDHLTAHGIEAPRLVARGEGTSEPADPRATPEAHARNRRVEFRLPPTDRPSSSQRSPRRWVPEGCPDAPPVRPGPCR